MIRSVYRFYGVLALASIGMLTLILIRSGLHYGNGLLAYLLSINIATMAFYGYDKLIAGSGWVRVPELVLHSLALAGGSPAALLAQRLLRHKSLKPAFRIVFWLIVALQITGLTWVGIHYY